MYKRILKFLLPWACAGCRTALGTVEDSGFCGLCWLKLKRIDGLICALCGLPLKDGGNTCYDCRDMPSKIVIRAATVYDAKMRSAIHRFKYAGRKTLSTPLSILLTNAWSRFREVQTVQTIVPVPLHASTFRLRGYNQSMLLAQSLSEHTGLPVEGSILRRSRATRPQFSLKKPERWANVTNAFDAEPIEAIQKSNILLIDDVCTTGATLMECARALRDAGSGPVRALVLARDL